MSRITLATYADDTAILASNNNPDRATHDVRFHLNLITNLTNYRKTKINEKVGSEEKKCPQLSLKNVPIPIQQIQLRCSEVVHSLLFFCEIFFMLLA